MKGKILKILREYEDLISDLVSCYLYPDIPKKKDKNAKKSHELDIYDEILFLNDHTLFGSATESTIITDKGISIVDDDSEPPILIKWEKIDHVDFTGDNFHFFYDTENQNDRYDIYKGSITSSLESDDDKNKPFAEMLTEIASLFENEEKKIYNEIIKHFENKDVDTFFELTEKYIQQYGKEGEYHFEIRAARAQNYNAINKSKKALKEINFNIEEIESVKESLGEDFDYDGLAYIFGIKGDILSNLNRTYEALQHYQFAFNEETDKEAKDLLAESIDNTYSTFKSNFLEQEYQNRKVILIDNKFYDLSTNAFSVILKHKLPDVIFPIGHPVEKELYVGHPYNNKIYIPISILEEALFMDRFQEFSYFLQSLGATKISIENKRGKAVEQMDSSDAETNVSAELGKAGVSIASAETNKTASSNIEQSQNSYKQISREQIFSPTKKPFLPENLVWYSHEPSWQRLYEQRVNGNLLVHNEVISTEQHQVISQNEKRSLQQSLQYYLSNADVSHSIDTSHMFTEKETTEWIIHVEFAPINELTGNVSEMKIQTENKLDISENEQKYIEEIKFMLDDDGQIDEDERRMLERKRQKYGISEEKALELEKSLMSSNDLTTEELEYIEELKECATDGEISDGDRRILKRLANKLGVSEERAKELESLALKTEKERVYTADEQKYIEEIKFCLDDDGEISASERRMLNKERDKLGIASERAEYIEQEFIKEIKK